jgi:hypothetical protein
MLPKSSESNTEHPDDKLRATLQHELMGAFLGRSEYDRASVLTLYWEEDDFEPPCKTEVEIVNELFRNDFRYETIGFSGFQMPQRWSEQPSYRVLLRPWR